MKITTAPSKNVDIRAVGRRSSLRSDGFDEWDSRFMLRTDQDDFGTGYNDMWGQKTWFKPSCIPITIILLLIVLVVILPLLDAAEKHSRFAAHNETLSACQQHCIFSLVETIPDGMSYRNSSFSHATTYDIWKGMIANANKTIEIATYYFTLRSADTPKTGGGDYPGVYRGEDIFNQLLIAGRDRGLTVKIAQSEPSSSMPDEDTVILARKGNADVRNVNMVKLVGGGVLHTKLWIVDRREAYIGSANTDWRALAHVKELGVYVKDCPCLLDDIGKLFDAYWQVASPNDVIPDKWPDSLATDFNEFLPMSIFINNTRANVYLSSSPPEMCPQGRESDIDSVLSVMNKADQFIYISVMTYYPLMLYTAKPLYWPVIDDALRSASIDRKVEVRLLISYWVNHTAERQRMVLKSIQALNNAYTGVNITARYFLVPSTTEQAEIPYARVNHNKYMVTDNTAYIGTSNWSGDYFVNTAGIGVVVTNEMYRAQLESIFHRDWNSEFSYPI